MCHQLPNFLILPEMQMLRCLYTLQLAEFMGTSDQPFHESQATQSKLPNNFYVSSKWCAETLIHNYREFF